MNIYFSRLTSSARGEDFNILSWLFLVPTFVTGLMMVLTGSLDIGGAAVLMSAALNVVMPGSAVVWGIIAMFNIIMGATFLLFDFPPSGKISGIFGFMLWIWAGYCLAHAGLYMLVGVLALPQALFWIWQYLTLSRFGLETMLDRQTMVDYNHGDYDDELNPKDGKIARDHNRGRDIQSAGKYDTKDDGRDSSRHLDCD